MTALDLTDQTHSLVNWVHGHAEVHLARYVPTAYFNSVAAKHAVGPQCVVRLLESHDCLPGVCCI